MDMTTRTSIRTNDPYLKWLCDKVKLGEEYGKPYTKLAYELHQQKFIPNKSSPMDRNRLYDGVSLRVQFMQKHGELGTSTNRGSCTMFEFLVGISDRMSFLMAAENEESKTPFYFWCLIRNLRLLKLDDDRFDTLNGAFFVEDAVRRVLDRNYDYNGDGGLFPLFRPTEDQRNVEIWYQMQAWLGEHCSIDIE